MKQLELKLEPVAQQPVPNNVAAALRSLYDCFYFDFPGRINKIESRKGQFQYRYGKKVQPKDRRIK